MGPFYLVLSKMYLFILFHQFVFYHFALFATRYFYHVIFLSEINLDELFENEIGIAF